MSKRSHKIEGIKVYFLFLLDDRRIRIQEAQKHVDPVDPDSDPQLTIVFGQCRTDPYVFGPPRFGICHYLYGSGSGSFHLQAKKVKEKPWFLSNKQKNFEKNNFCWHLVSHWRKKALSWSKAGSRLVSQWCGIGSVPKCQFQNVTDPQHYVWRPVL